MLVLSSMFVAPSHHNSMCSDIEGLSNQTLAMISHECLGISNHQLYIFKHSIEQQEFFA